MPETRIAAPLRIFLSYGHDANEELVRRIKADLEKRGHDVWFDQSEIKAGDDWRRSITDGITRSHKFVSFLSKHSTRDPGVCRDEIAIAIGVKGGNIQTILVESEQEVQPPVNIGHIQWLDMHDWKERRAAGEAAWQEWYQAKLAEIVRVVESDESRRFAGEIETLNGHLKPIKSEARICQLLGKGFYGRQWLFEAVENWRTTPQGGPSGTHRLFWIVGAPGVGKSAFAAQLTHTRCDTVIAAQFCEWDKPDHRHAPRVVRSLAFQLATRLPDYRKLLLTLPEIAKLDEPDPFAKRPKNEAELFDYLLANPLRSVIHGGRERYLIVIDALDEACEADRNPLVDMLARNAQRLPDWLGLVVTSRPEFDVKTPLQAMNPFALDTQSESNRADIRDYLRRELATQLQNRPDADCLVEQILEKSEGVFLYIERFCDDVQHSHLLLDRPEQFPQGLGGIFYQYFQRKFSDLEQFRKNVRPALRAILAAREPLPVEILQHLFNWQDEELRDFTRTLGSLFPVTKEANCEVIKPYHKSLADWLTNHAKASTFFVDEAEGHRLLADFGWREYRGTNEPLPQYIIAHLTHHLIASERLEDLVGLLLDLKWLEAKCSVGLSFAIVNDFDAALQVLPENHQTRGVLELLGTAIRLNLHFIAMRSEAYPQALFQCVWNSCWWFGCADKAKWYEIRPIPDQLNPTLPLPPNPSPQRAEHLFRNEVCDLQDLLERWRNEKRSRCGCFPWLRSLLPAPFGLESGIALTLLNCHYLVALSPDGNRIATLQEDENWFTDSSHARYRLAVWRIDRLSEGPLLLNVGDLDLGGWLNGATISFTRDSQRVVAIFRNGSLKVWQLDNQILTSASVLPQQKIRALSFSNDGQLLAVVLENDTVEIWQFDGLNLRFLMSAGQFEGVTAAAVSCDARHILTGLQDGSIRLLSRTEAGSETHMLCAHRDQVTGLAFSMDGCRIASCSKDSTICVWRNQPLDQSPLVLTGHSDWPTCVAFAPDGHTVASASIDGTLRSWQLDRASLEPQPFGNDWINLKSQVTIWPAGRRLFAQRIILYVHVSNGEGGPFVDIDPISKGFERLNSVRPSVNSLLLGETVCSEFFGGSVGSLNFVRGADGICLGRGGIHLFVLKLEKD